MNRRKTIAFLVLGLLVIGAPAVHADVLLFNPGTTSTGDAATFGEFGAGTETEGTTDILAEGSGGSFPIMLGMSRGAFDFSALNAADSLVISARKDTNGTSTVTNASLRFVDSGFNLVARWNFDLSADLSTTLGDVVIGTIGAPNVTGGGDATDVTAVVFQAETASAGTWDFTIESISAVTPIPEPASALLLGLGAFCVLAGRMRQEGR